MVVVTASKHDNQKSSSEVHFDMKKMVSEEVSVDPTGDLRTRVGDCAFFLFGFAKNERANLSAKNLQALKLLAAHLLSYNACALDKALRVNELYEVEHHE